jgi:hypothetical protein
MLLSVMVPPLSLTFHSLRLSLVHTTQHLASERVEVIQRVDKDYVVVSSSTGGVQRILARHVLVDGGLELDMALMLSDLELGKLAFLSLRKLRGLTSELYIRIIDAIPLCTRK